MKDKEEAKRTDVDVDVEGMEEEEDEEMDFDNDYAKDHQDNEVHPADLLARLA